MHNRKGKRIPLHLPVELCSTAADVTILHCQSKDLSVGGACVKAMPTEGLPKLEAGFAVGQALTVEFRLPGGGQSIKADAQIRWLDTCLDDRNQQRLYAAGMRFTNLPQQSRTTIAQLITQLLRRPTAGNS